MEKTREEELLLAAVRRAAKGTEEAQRRLAQAIRTARRLDVSLTRIAEAARVSREKVRVLAGEARWTEKES